MPAVSTKRHELAADLDEFVDRIARGARELVDDHALFARRLVEQARLADVRAAEQGDPAGTADLLLGHRRHLGQHLHDVVEQIGDAAPVHGADRPRLAEPEAPQLGGLRVADRVVGLVGTRMTGACSRAASAHVLIGGGGADVDVDDEQDGIRQVDGHLGLGGHGGIDALGVGLPAPVSTTVKRRPSHSALYETRSRVTPGVSSTTASRRPMMRFTRADLPTFGRPTIASTGSAGR
jgi:hypothetical protein